MKIGLITTLFVISEALGGSLFPADYPQPMIIADRTDLAASFRTVDLDSTELDSLIEEIRLQGNVAGISACIVKDGDIFWDGQYGYANFEENRMVADSTLYMLASVCKPVTGTALMQLYEDGLIGLDEDLNQCLPYSIGVPVYPDSAITARMLMTHTSSIRDNWDVLDPLAGVGDPSIMLDEFTSGYLVEGGNLYDAMNYYNHVPGSLWSYSNVAVTLIGYLVEVLSGMTFEEYCQQNIFLPLKMDESSWFLANLDTNNIAMLYNWTGEEFIPYGHMGRPWYPAGQLRTSAPQLGRFLAAFMGYGELDSVRILDSATVDMMWTIQLPGWVDSMGLIWNWEFRAGRWTWAHGGSSWGTRTAMSYCPDEETGVIVLTNGQSGWAVAEIEQLLYDYAAENAEVIEPENAIPSEFSMIVFPNPFNNRSIIEFSLERAGQVKLSVYDLTGRIVAILADRYMSSGSHEIRFEASLLPSGVYFARLENNQRVQIQKLLLLK